MPVARPSILRAPPARSVDEPLFQGLVNQSAGSELAENDEPPRPGSVTAPSPVLFAIVPVIAPWAKSRAVLSIDAVQVSRRPGAADAGEATIKGAVPRTSARAV